MEAFCPHSAARPTSNAPELEPIEPIDVAEPFIIIMTPMEAGGCRNTVLGVTSTLSRVP